MSRKAIIAVVLVVVLAAFGIGYYVLGNSSADAGDNGAKNVGFTAACQRPHHGQSQGAGDADRICRAHLPGLRQFHRQRVPAAQEGLYRHRQDLLRLPRLPAAPRWTAMAEKIARCLPEDKYFAFIDLLFRNQPKWDAAEYPGIADPHGELIKQARVSGMSAEQVDQCMANKAEDDRINKVSADGEARNTASPARPPSSLNGVPQSDPATVPYDRSGKSSWTPRSPSRNRRPAHSQA